jgi:RimJ/RimL family protein N-acetyltransferase
VIELSHAEAQRLRPWFAAERPGPDTIAAHVLATGIGRWWVDRWPDPRAVLVDCAGNYLLRGDPRALTARELHPHVYGFVAAPPRFEALLRGLSQPVTAWPRVVAELADDWPGPADPAGVTVRPLQAGDADAVDGLDAENDWICNTWGGPAGLAASGYAWGAFVAGSLASVACTFFRGDRYEEIGVVSQAGYRRRSLSTMCTTALCVDILARGRRPSWTTSTDNVASRRVAEKAGFRWVREDVLYVVGFAPPEG